MAISNNEVEVTCCPSINPHKELYRALICRAVLDLRRGIAYANNAEDRYNTSKWRDTAIQWLNGANAPVTFADCCLALDFNHSVILGELKKQGLLP